MRRTLTIVVAAIFLTGCGGARGPATTPAELDVVALLRTLPTPAGYDQSTDVTRADTAAIQVIFAQGTVDAVAAKKYADIGFKDGAIRRWTGPSNTTFTVVASRWDDHQTAATVGGGAAEVIPLSRGAAAWTPASLNGARGTKTASSSPVMTTLSLAIGDVDVFILATGRADTAPVERTMNLVRTSLGA
jgi:hypothetical protein